jgi:DNA-directed RNA polymerase subunit K/omega
MNSDDENILETEDVVEEPEIDELLDEPEIELENDQENEQENEEEEDFDCVDMDVKPEIIYTTIITEPTKRKSKNMMTRYEFVRIIGERVVQLTKGAKPLIKQSKLSEELSYQEIAIEELKTNMIPFKIRRFVKDHYEIWKIDELNKKHLEPLFY